jgi:1-phosphofructokinase
MIYTVTLNPAVDYKIKLKELKTGKLNRTDEAHVFAGGKGLNVSIVLNNLGMKSIATGFLGGFTGNFIKHELKKFPYIYDYFVEIEHDTRINIKINDDQHETEVNPNGPIIKEDDFNKLLEDLKDLNAQDTVIVSGSTAYGQDLCYRRIAEICSKKQVKFVMDIPGKYFHEFLEFKPFLIKPNIDELKEYFDRDIESKEEIITYGKKLLELGAQHVIISLGKQGSIFLSASKIFTADAIELDLKSTTGAGDSMVAGFIYAYHQDKDLAKSYQYAVATATATIQADHLASKHEVELYLNQVILKELSS